MEILGSMLQTLEVTVTKEIELACFGRLAVDFYGIQFQTRLEDATSFRRYLGGSSGNLAVGSSRLGLATAMVSRVGKDPMGIYLTERLKAEGVDLSALGVDPSRKTALAFLGMEGAEAVGLDFYRNDPADGAANLSDLPDGFFNRVDCVAVTGSHFADPNTFSNAIEMVTKAIEAGCRIVLDIDLREVLWADKDGDLSAAVARVLKVVAVSDLVVGNMDEFFAISGHRDVLSAAEKLRAESAATFVFKLGTEGVAALSGADRIEKASLVTVSGLSVETLNPVGAGDAFLAGFLSRWIKGASLAEALVRGNAAGALVVTRHACSEATPYSAELDHFIRTQLPHDKELAHIHRVSGRRARIAPIMALACDHREPMVALMTAHGRSQQDAEHFKGLVVQAAENVMTKLGCTQGAMLLDPQFASNGLAHLTANDWWLGRPIEVTGSRPLRTEAGENLGADMSRWNPKHVAKCLVWYHPDDEDALKAQQIETLRQLEAACHESNVEWMLEVVPPLSLGFDDKTLLRCVDQMYEAGLKPDYLKLPSLETQAGWDAMQALIRQKDPYCRGVVVLGLNQPLDALSASLQLAASQPLCVGFAIGRTVFGEASVGWFSGSLSDEDAVADMSGKFRVLVDQFLAAQARSDHPVQSEVSA